MQNSKKLSQIDNFITLIEPVDKESWTSQKKAKQNFNNINNNNNTNNTININMNQDKITNQNNDYNFPDQLSIQSSVINFLIEPNSFQSPFPKDFFDPFSISKDQEPQTQFKQDQQNKFESYDWMEKNIAENYKVPIDSDNQFDELLNDFNSDQFIPVTHSETTTREIEQAINSSITNFYDTKNTIEDREKEEKRKGKKQTIIKPPVSKYHQEIDSCCAVSHQKRKCEEIIIQETKKVRGTPPKPKDGDPEKLKIYEEVRKKNNFSARQSRTKKKVRDEQNLKKLQFLEEENAQLRVLLDSIKKEAQTLKELLQMTIQNNTFP